MVLTVDSTTGNEAAHSAGVAAVTFHPTAGCNVTAMVTVNALPAAISGSPLIFMGGSAGFTNATAGGTWSTSNTAVATIDAASGVISGVAGGSVYVSYTLGTGCRALTTTTVVGIPAPIAGISTVCQGATATLTDPSIGGVWTSSNTSVATIGSTSGVVTGISAGSAAMSYTVGGVTSSVTITVIPLAGPLSGDSTLCAGATVTLSNPVAGGTWSSSDLSVAPVSGSGVVTGLAAGAALVTYSTGCGVAAVKAVTVFPMPDAGAITGPDGLCIGSSVTLGNDATGGTWSAATGIVSIDAGTGLMTGLAISGTMISYTNTNEYGCTSRATKSVRVSGAPGNI
jgi:hypothetical protein